MILLLKCRPLLSVLRLKIPAVKPILNSNFPAVIQRTASTDGALLRPLKDIILFHYENPKFYKRLNLFAMFQFMFWAFMGQFSISSMRDVPVPEDISEELPWWRKVNLGEGKYKHTLSLFCYLFGTGILACSWLYTLRSVRYLILNKGGKFVSLVTYTPYGENRILKVPMDKVSAKMGRLSATSYLPIKVHGHKLHYVLDMRGDFRNTQLFDITAGVRRRL